MAAIDRDKYDVKCLAERSGHKLTRFVRTNTSSWCSWVARCKQCQMRFTVRNIAGYYRGRAGFCEDDLDSPCPNAEDDK